ncbi:MAG: hypothetical protein AAGA48_36635 [Myxococcota bacterium]
MTPPPESVVLLPDGFSVELLGRRTEERAIGAMVGLMGVGAIAVFGWFPDTGSLRQMLSLGIWLLIGLLAVLGADILVLLVAPIRVTPVELAGFVLKVGPQRIAVADIRDVRLRLRHLVIDADKRYVVPASHVPSPLRRWVRDRLVERVTEWQNRDGEAPPELESLLDRPS